MCLPIYPSMLPFRSDYAKEAGFHGIAFLHLNPAWMRDWTEERVQKQLPGISWQSFATKSTQKHCFAGYRPAQLRQSGLPAAGPIRPSLPWCLSLAGGSVDRSYAGQKPAARGRKQVGSWQCRKASKWKV